MAKIKAEAEKEAVLLALDQLSQTMEVMRQVVGRLKRSIEQTSNPDLQARKEAICEEESESSGTLH
jgi:hypothetical protein